MPRKKKTETTDSIETPKKEEQTITFSSYGSEALKENAKLKKPSLRGSLKQISHLREYRIVLSAAGFPFPAAVSITK